MFQEDRITKTAIWGFEKCTFKDLDDLTFQNMEESPSSKKCTITRKDSNDHCQ